MIANGGEDEAAADPAGGDDRHHARRAGQISWRKIDTGQEDSLAVRI
jgi:hypothetical protein